jgi:hypothetical protein
VAFVIVGVAFNLSWSHWQQGLGPIKRLYLGLFIYAEHQSAVWRGRIQPHNVAYLLNKEWIGRQFERLGPMRL